MSIQIAQRLKPFCHLPGSCCVIPHSTWQIQAFPTLFRFTDLLHFQQIEFPLAIEGPVDQFTVEQDLEKGRVVVFGKAKTGFFRYFISLQPDQGLVIEEEKQKTSQVLKAGTSPYQKSEERLSLGMHKALDWEMVKRRSDLKEIFPVWLKLGQGLPQIFKMDRLVGTAVFLKSCPKDELVDQFLKLFKTGFSSLMAPRLRDEDHQGIIPEQNIPPNLSPLILLTEGAKLIRALFFLEERESWSLLPCLPSEFHSGRFTDIRTAQGDRIDLEWRGKQLRRARIAAQSDREIHLQLQKGLDGFRVRTSVKSKGKRHSVSQPLLLKKGTTFYLDRFVK